MRKFLTATAVLGLLVSPAAARDWTKEESAAGLQKYENTRFVPSGVERMLGFLYALKPDCSALGPVVVRKTTEPIHGTIEVVQSEGTSTYKPDSKYFKCNDNPVPGVVINYKSADDYVGPDNFRVLVLYPSGLAHEVIYKVLVR